MDNSNKSINLYGLIIGIILIIVLTKLSSYLTPYRLYFSFTSFLFEDRSTLRWESLIIKMMIPCIVGYFLFYIPYLYSHMEGNKGLRLRLDDYLSKQVIETSKVCGFFSALLLAWPYIVYWDMLMHPVYQHLQIPYLLIYLFYIVSYAYFAELGANLASATVSKTNNDFVIDKKYSWIETVRTSFMGIVTSGIATYFANSLANSY